MPEEQQKSFWPSDKRQLSRAWLMLDRFKALNGVRGGGTVVRRSVRAGPSRPWRALQHLGFQTVSTRQRNYAPLLRLPTLVITESAEGRCFLCERRLGARATPADVDRLPAWFASFLPFFAPVRRVPAQGCVSGRPLNRSPAMALIPPAARGLPLSSSPRSAAAMPPDNGRNGCSGRNCPSAV